METFCAHKLGHHQHSGPQRAHLLREGKKVEVKGGVDFTDAVFDEESGRRCIKREVEVDTMNKQPVLECTHK